MSRAEKLKNRILRLAAVLLCLTLLSAWATGKMYARYSTGVTYQDGARVAKFNIAESGTLTQNIEITGMKPGDTQEYTVTVTSVSEVAVYYTIAVENVYKSLPLKFDIEYGNAGEIDKATIAPNETDEKTYTLRVTWPENESSPSYAGKVDVLAITLKAVQVD